INQVHHARQKLRAHAAALGAVSHFELELFDGALFLKAEPVPPGSERIDNEVAGLGRTPEGHREVGSSFIEEPTRDILLRLPEIRVPRLVLPTRAPASRERAQLDRGF